MAGKRTVLVVEDEGDLLFTIKLTLELAGYEVAQASSGEEALQVLEEHHPDGVVLDIRLPGIDGWEVLRRMRQGRETLPIPVVLLSAQVDTATAARAADLGCQAYLAKPFSPPELTRVLAALLAEPTGP